MRVLYKSLMEVKLLHEYFVTKKDGATPFGLNDQASRLDFLKQAFIENRASVNRDLSFEFPGKLKGIYDGLQLKLVTSYSGCGLFVKATTKKLPDNTIVYVPAVALPEKLNIYILLSKKGNLIERYTNSRMRNAIPAVYFFSNTGNSQLRTFPYLTSTIQNYSSSIFYEQGQLASFGPADCRQYFADDTGDNWQQVNGSFFANENDQLLVPFQFDYTFIDDVRLNNVSFVLKDKKGNELKSTIFSNDAGLEKVHLNFSELASTIGLTESNPPDERACLLEISGNGGFIKKHTLLFSDFVSNQNHWGVIHLVVKPENTEYHLLDKDDYLKTDSHPLEISVKSRFNYWRFLNDKGKELKLEQVHEGYLVKPGEQKFLVTINPVPLSQSCFSIPRHSGSDANDVNINRLYAPNPIDMNPVRDPNKTDRIYFDIKVPESTLFPIQ